MRILRAWRQGDSNLSKVTWTTMAWRWAAMAWGWMPGLLYSGPAYLPTHCIT